MFVHDQTHGRDFYGVRIRGRYFGVVLRRYLYDTRLFLVTGGTTTPLLQWKKGR